MNEIKQKKKNIFDNFENKYKKIIKWEEVKDCKTWEKIWDKIEEIYKCAENFCSSDFCANEFKPPLTIEKLCKVINDDNYNILLKAEINTIDWLNELLKVPDFYDKVHAKKPNMSFPKNITELAGKTNQYRNKNFSDLKNDELNNMKGLNRLLLEETYPLETPKSQNILFGDDLEGLEELKNIKEKSKDKINDEFIKRLEEIFNQNHNNLKYFLTMEFLWGNRKLTEEIAPEIIEDFDCVTAKEGTIHIVVSLPLGYFLRNEEKFQKLRLTDDWKNYIDYVEREGNLIWPLHQNGIFTPDPRERELEKTCYDIKAFRGITYNEILTPIYKLERSNFCRIIQNEIGTISSSNLDNQKKEFFKYVLRKIQELLTGWDIKVRITKGGLVNIFFEKDFTNRDYNIKEFADKKGNLMINPYSEEELTKIFPSNLHCRERFKKRKLLKKEQIFTSYLNAAAIWIIHIFLRNCNLDQNLVPEIAPRILERITHIVRNLKDPWDVGHKAPHTEEPPRHDMPPLRNYCVIFLLKGVQGLAWGFNKPLSTKIHFDCPGDIFSCEKKAECFIRYLGHSLLALSTNTYVYKDNELKRPWFTQKELENFAKRDLSRWRGELCFIDSETILICTPSDIVYINKEGQLVKYDDYWKSIIKGLSLLVSCKTLAMDISRLLFEYIGQYRENDKKEEEMLEKLKIISHLLSRTRFIATPSNISRARYIREKLEAYIKTIGLPEIIHNIEKDYDELNEAIHSSIESNRTEQIKYLTFLLVPLAFVTVFGTLVLALIELDKFNDIICIINIIKNNRFLICFAFFVSFISILAGWRLLKLFFKIKK